MKKMRNKVPLERHKCNPSNINICLNFNEEYTVCHQKSLNHAASKSKSKGIQFDKTVMKLDDLHKGQSSKEGESANTQVLIEETNTKEKEIYATIDYPYNISKSNQRKNKLNQSYITKKTKCKKDKLILPYDSATIQFHDSEDLNIIQSAIIPQTYRSKINQNEKRSQIKKKRRKSKLSSDQLFGARDKETTERVSDKFRKYPSTIQVDKILLGLRGKRRKIKENMIKTEQKIDLKKKLQIFHLDIIKLATYYENESLINSKKTVDHDQKSVLKRRNEICLDFINQPDLSKQFHEIHQYQTNKEYFNIVQPQIQEHQMLINDKQNVSSELSRLCELGKLFTKEQQHVREDKSSEIYSQQRITQKQIPQDSFINDLLQKYQYLSIKQKEKLKQLFSAFQKQQKKSTKIEDKQGTLQNIVQVPIQDILINRQIQTIKEKKEQFSSEFYLDELELAKITQWQQDYRRQLINIKKRMWSQYKVLKSLANKKHTKTVSTKQKSPRIMKCLSQKVFSSITRQAQSFLSLMNEADQQNLITYEFTNLKQPDYFDKQHKKYQLLPTYVNIQNDTSNQEQSAEEISYWDNQLVTFQQKSNEPLLWQQQPFKIKLHEISITTQEKQDIFESIFIDLILQIYQKQLLKQSQRSHVQSPQNRIYSKLKEWIIESKQKDKKKIGFSTSINAVQAICTKMVNLLSSEIKIDNNQLNIRQNILKQLNASAGPTELELLAALRFYYDKQEPIMKQNLDDVQACEILAGQVFNYFQFDVIQIKQLKFSPYFDYQQKEQQRVRFLRNSVHIHNKAIYDSLSESLQFQRRYNSWGKPFCWKTTIFHSDKQIQSNQIDKILAKAQQTTIECANNICGLLIDKQDSLVSHLAMKQTLLAELQQARMQKMLEKYVEQSNERWIRFDDQQAETELEVSHLIWRQLLDQLIKELPL